MCFCVYVFDFFFFFFFFFNDTATTEIYTLSLHDALPILGDLGIGEPAARLGLLQRKRLELARRLAADRKSTRLNSSHSSISYAVFCLKKKKTTNSFFTLHNKRKKKQKIN